MWLQLGSTAGLSLVVTSNELHRFFGIILLLFCAGDVAIPGQTAFSIPANVIILITRRSVHVSI